ncbi:MAG: hypothetical protein ACREYE_23590 [Gammaproteobacteria bacterium]
MNSTWKMIREMLIEKYDGNPEVLLDDLNLEIEDLIDVLASSDSWGTLRERLIDKYASDSGALLQYLGADVLARQLHMRQKLARDIKSRGDQMKEYENWDTLRERLIDKYDGDSEALLQDMGMEIEDLIDHLAEIIVDNIDTLDPNQED